MSLDQEIDPRTTTLIIDVPYGPDNEENRRCHQFALYPGVCEGQQLEIIVKNICHYVIQNVNKYENFFELHFRKNGQTALLVWNQEIGWSVLSTVDSPRDNSLSDNKPVYLL